MTTVTFRNGFTVSDDNNSSTTLKNGGHRTRFVPALEGVVLAADESKKWSNLLGTVVYDAEYSAKEYAVGNTCPTGSAKSWATGNGVIAGGVYSAKYYAEQSQSFSNSAVNAPGTSATSTSPLTIGTGNKTLDIQPGKAFTPGQFVIIADQTTPANYMVGQITAHNNVTGSLTVNVTAVGGVGVGLMNWIISLTALANVAGAATLGANNAFSGNNTFAGTSSFTGDITSVNLTVSGLLSATGTVDISGTSAKRSRASGASDFVVENAGVTSGDYSTVKLKTPNKTWTLGTTGDTNSFYITDGTVTLVDYLPNTDKTVIRKPQRTDAAVAANDLVRKAELDNATVESIITTTQGALSGFRNRVINGSMSVQQRTASQTILTNTNNVYRSIIDRIETAVNYISASLSMQAAGYNFHSNWYASLLSQGAVAGSSGFENTWYHSGIRTTLEDYNTSDLRYKPVVVSFMFRASVNGNYGFTISKSTRTYCTTFSYTGNGEPQTIVIALPAITTGQLSSYRPFGSFDCKISIGCVGGSSNIVATNNSWVSNVGGPYLVPIGALNWSNTNGAFIQVTDLQLEQGSVATPFEQRPYAVELALCQRYYQTGDIYGAGYVVGAGGVRMGYSKFYVPMRGTPTIDPVGITYANASGFTSEAVTTNGFGYYVTASAAGGVNVNGSFIARSE
jgi:hypothetical protein